MELIDYLIATRVLKTQRLIDAFKTIHRSDFVRSTEKLEAGEDKALPIGFEQTISQPTVVAFMLELLAPKPGDRILDIGCGSAWTTALLAYCVQPTGEVIGVEILPELVVFGRSNLEKYNFNNVQILQADPKILGLPQKAPFDKILVSAAAQKLPRELLSQMTQKLVIPIQNSIFEITPTKSKEYPGFAFVPLLQNTFPITK